MSHGIYQAYSGQRKEKDGKTGFLRILVSNLTGGTFFSIKDEGSTETIVTFTTAQRGARALREFRQDSGLVFSIDWIRSKTEQTYLRRNKKIR